MQTISSDAIATLMDEHQAVKTRFEELLDAHCERRADLLEEIKNMLAVHNATEENVIYPAIHSMVQRPMHARTLYHEQDDAEIAIWELSTLDPDDPEFIRKGAELFDALLAHVRREEDGEFKHLRDELRPEDMRELTAEFQAFRAALAGGSPNGS